MATKIMVNKNKATSDTFVSSIFSTFLIFVVQGNSIAASADQALPDPKLTEYWRPVVKHVVPFPLPSDATVLFDGTDLSQWQHDEQTPASWIVNDGMMTVKPGSTGIETKQAFCDIQLHIEWRSPPIEPDKKGQQRGNSGVFLQKRYEVQILNSYKNDTYVNGQAASIYKQSAPLVNASLPAQQWQTYDIIYKAPVFSGNGELSTPAVMTVIHNGVLVQNHFELTGPTVYRGQAKYGPAHGCDSIALQDHGDKVSFRNIWLREL